MSVRVYNNNASDTLNGAITNSATTITLNDASEFPTPGAGEIGYATIDDGTNVEIITYTGISTNDLTGVTRGVEGTSGTAFADATTVEQRATEASFTDVLQADETPELQGPLDCSNSGVYIGFGGSSSSTAYCLNHTANVPRLIGAANFYWGFSGSALYCQAGTTFNKIEFANDSNRFRIWTNNSERFQVDDSGVNISNGDLNLNDNKITTTTTNGDITLDSDGTGNIIFENDASELARIQSGGELLLGTTTLPTNTDIILQSSTGFLGLTDSSSDATNKTGAFVVPHYTNAEEPFGIIRAQTQTTNNYVDFGGGLSTANAATRIRMMCAANNTTTTGSEVARFTSSGLSFDSGSNFLNDYEEGTFTASVTAQTVGDLSVSYGVRVGRYTRIGNRVFFTIRIELSSFTYSTASGQLRISGLPITSDSTANNISTCAASLDEWNNGGTETSIAGRIVNNVSYVRFLGSPNDGSSWGDINITHFASGSTPRFEVSGVYEV